MIFTEDDMVKAFALWGTGLSYDETVDIIKLDYKDTTQTQKLDLIMEAVLNYFRINKDYLISPNRSRNVLDARGIYYLLARRLTEKSLSEIGRAVNKDHATVLNGFRKISNFIEVGDQGIIQALNGVTKLYEAYEEAKSVENNV